MALLYKKGVLSPDFTHMQFHVSCLAVRVTSQIYPRIQVALGIQLSMEQQKVDEEKFKLVLFADLKTRINHISLLKDWILWPSDENRIHFIKPGISKVNGAHLIRCSLSIDDTFHVEGFFDNKEIYLLTQQIQDIREVENLIQEISYLTPCNYPPNFHSLQLITILMKLLNI